MKPDEFETKLSRQPLRTLPPDWRAEIVAQAKRAAPAAPRARFLSTIHYQLSTFFWPHPKAWAGLAAVWIFIIAVNFSLREPSARIGEKSAPPSPEVLVELKKQRRLFAELVGANEAPDVDRRKIFSPKPRSQRGEILMT